MSIPVRRLCTAPFHQGPRWLLALNFATKTKDDQGRAKTLQSWCRHCQKLEARERQGIARRGVPYGERKPSKLGLRTGPNGYIAETEEEKEILRAYQRERYANLTPEQRANRREADRFRAEAMRRKAGMKPREAMLQKRRIPGRLTERLPIEPVAQLLDSWDEPVLALARRIGVDERVLRRVIDRVDADEQPTDSITLHMADKICMGVGLPMSLVYEDMELLAS